MLISGFTFVRNGSKLAYPFTEAIRSILPICDEFIVAAGKSEDDTTEKIIDIGDPKIKIVETEWDPALFKNGAIYAQQTNLALNKCKGDWCFYIQSDEVVHEKYLPVIKSKCLEFSDQTEVEGILFDYIHFWGSFYKYQISRNWYRAEIRIVRNNIGIESFRDAQSFRINERKLKVIKADAYIYHYGWVRPTFTMKKKKIVMDSYYHDQNWVQRHNPEPDSEFDYGNLRNLAEFKGTHPAVMEGFIKKTTPLIPINLESKKKHTHDKLGIRILSWIERNLLHYRIGEWNNYTLVNPQSKN